MTDAKGFKCPNCGSPAKPTEGGKHVCTNAGCGAVFHVDQGEGRLDGAVDLDKLRKDVDQVKSHQDELDELLNRGQIEPADDTDDTDQGEGVPDDDDDADDEDW